MAPPPDRTNQPPAAALPEAQAEATLRWLVEQVPAVLWTMDADLRFTSSQGAGLIFLGLSPGQAVGLTIYEFFQSTDTSFAPIAHHLRALAGESVTYDNAWQDHLYRNRLEPLRDAHGRIVGVIGVAQDITANALLAERLRQAQKMEAVGQLAGGIAHDFNNLLTVISGYGEIHLASIAVGDPRRVQVEHILAAAGRAARLTRQLLAFSRRQVLLPRLVDLNVLVRDLYRMLRRLLDTRIAVELQLCDQPCIVHADPSQLEQVLLNLAVNARDAMPDGGTLTLATARRDAIPDQPGDWVRLSVRDTGIGMDAETRGRIFEPFFTTKEVGKGTGLGLATVYGIVMQSGGHIGVDSAPGAGAAFTILLPRAEGQPPGDSAAPEALPTDQADGTVLVVEDSPDVRALTCDILASHGYEVLSASDGAQALPLYRANAGRIDLVLSDLVMPTMDGQELAARLVAEGWETPVLFMSGHAQRDLLPRGAPGAAIGFIEKPFTSLTLLRAVRTALAEHRDRRKA
ncbi:MAG: response regulator [Planctomycetes bacterium]|nr:response regulator [Planctomycetota bacterium]